MNKNTFWYFLIPVLIAVTLLISLSPWIAEYLAAPPSQVFSGINRWSVDYFIYLSYVELGRRGQILTSLLHTTIPQQPIFAHVLYTIPGFIFGKILGLNSIIIYHFFRSFYGLLFLISTIVLFYQLSRNRLITLLSFLFTFYIGGFVKIDSLSPVQLSSYLGWIQEQNIVGRATGPLHYSIGFVFFILTFVWFFYSKSKIIKKILIFGLLCNLTLLANPFAFVILGASFCLYFFIRSLHVILIRQLTKRNLTSDKLRLKTEFITLVLGLLSSLPLFLYYNYHLSTETWGKTGMAPKYYVVLHPPIGLIDTIMSIGPSFILAILGIIIIFRGKSKIKINSSPVIFMIIWLMIQFFLFFFGDFIKTDPVRSFNGLYYLPLAFFSSIFIYWLFSKFDNKKLAVIIVILFLITIPNFYINYKNLLYAFTDFKYFQPMSYPYKNQVKAFQFLEKNTPVGSGVMAMFEASSLIIGFSGNSTELAMDHNIKVKFYSNQMTDIEAYQLLKKNNFKYVYFGYQEKSAGGSINKYPFLKKIFENEEALIYQVI